jgi:uncharacterized cupin superfamily protein
MPSSAPQGRVHAAQDELFYAMEDTFVVEIRAEHFELQPSDTLSAPPRMHSAGPRATACPSPAGLTRG